MFISRLTAPRSIVVRFCFAMVVALALLVGLARPAVVSAHAYLTKSSPESGASLDKSPTEIDLYFSESASLDFSSIKIYNRARAEQPVGEVGRVGKDDSTVQVSVPQALPAGVYTVVWKVVSASDGHLTVGSFAFRVKGSSGAGGQTGTPEPEGTVTPDESFTEGTVTNGEAQGSDDPFRWAIRGFILAASILLLGGCLFTLLISEPLLTEGKEPRNGKALWPLVGIRFARVGAIIACLLFFVLALDLVAEVATIGGTDYLTALSRGDQAVTLLLTTSYGFAWILKASAAVVLDLLMLATLLRMLRKRPGLWEFAIAVGSLLLLGVSLGSHAAAARTGLVFGLSLPVISDWLHQVVTSAWIGGLGYMIFILFPAFGEAKLPQEERRLFLARGIPKFSQLAVISVGVLIVTGTYNLAVHSTDVGAILSTTYGQVLLIKHVLLVGLIALGAVNLLRITPLLRSRNTTEGSPGKPGAVVQLRRNVRVEALLAAAALICAGGLTLLPPPNPVGASFTQGQGNPLTPASTPAEVAFPPTPLPTPGPAQVESTVAGYLFTLNTRPASEGDELTLTITKQDPASPPLTDVAKVYFKVTPQDINAGSIRYQATREGSLDPGKQVYTATEQILTLDGGYLITAIVQRTVAKDVEAAFRLDLSEDKGLKANPAQVVDIRLDSVPSPPISGTVKLNIKLLDGAGNPIDDAKLTVLPLMPAHGHVNAQAEGARVPGQPGLYTLTAPLQMGGSWLFVCDVERPGQPVVRVDTNLDVIDPNATPTLGAAP